MMMVSLLTISDNDSIDLGESPRERWVMHRLSNQLKIARASMFITLWR